MLSVIDFSLVMFIALIGQEILDRLALKYSFLGNFCIIFSLLANVFCVLIVSPDSGLRSDDSYIYLIVSAAGFIYFSIVRHWVFAARVRKIDSRY